MILEKLLIVLEHKYPKKNAEEWDNIGLMLGDKKSKIKKILIALDADLETVNEAIEKKVDLIITHHPFIFSPIKNILLDTLFGKKVEKLIKNDIAVYSMHTNIDSSRDGLNEYLLEKIGVKKSYILAENRENSEIGIGRYFKINEEFCVKDYIEKLKKDLELKNVILYGKKDCMEKNIKKIAVINGSGAGFWKKAKFFGCDFIITADIKYHDALDAVEDGVTLVDIGHYESEKFFMELVEKNIREFSSEIEIIKFEKKPIWRII